MKILSKLILLLLVANIYVYSQFSGGKGTEQEPYEIRTLEELEEVSNYPDKCFVQKANIRKPLTKPLCPDATKQFKGSYDGNNYFIELAIVDTAENSYGVAALFYNVYGNSVIKNVITKGYVKGKNYVGGIIAIAGCSDDKTTIQLFNCVNAAKIEGKFIVGGVVASWIGNGIIEKCQNLGTVTGLKDAIDIGGLLGCITGVHSYLIIKDCTNSGLIIDNSNTNPTGQCGSAGIVGHSIIYYTQQERLTISNCINNGIILVNGKDISRKRNGIANIHSY